MSRDDSTFGLSSSASRAAGSGDGDAECPSMGSMAVGVKAGVNAVDGVELVDTSFEDLPKFLLRVNMVELLFIASMNRLRFSSLSTMCAMTKMCLCDVISDC